MESNREQSSLLFFSLYIWMDYLKRVSVGNICIAWRKALRQLWGLAPLTHGDVVLLLSDSLPLLVNLKQRFIKFIHKALNHKWSVISSVAKLSIQNPWLNCGGNYCHIHYAYNMHEDVSASVIDCVWQAGVTDERISDMSVLSDMIEIRNGLKTCYVFSRDDVNKVITEITVF